MNSQKLGFLVITKIFNINEVVKDMKVYPVEYYVIMKNFMQFLKTSKMFTW